MWIYAKTKHLNKQGYAHTNGRDKRDCPGTFPFLPSTRWISSNKVLCWLQKASFPIYYIYYIYYNSLVTRMKRNTCPLLINYEILCYSNQMDRDSRIPRDSIYEIVSLEHRVNFIPFYFCFLFICTRISISVLNRGGKYGHPCSVTLQEKILNSLLFGIVLMMGLSVRLLLCWGTSFYS